MGFMGVRNNNTFRREARAVESLVLFISDRVREGAEFLCNVNFHNSALFVLVGGGSSAAHTGFVWVFHV